MRIALINNLPQDDSILPMSTLTLAAVSRRCGVEVDLYDLSPRGKEEELYQAVAGFDVVGFSCVCSDYPRILLMAERLKREEPNRKIVLGGPQATSTARQTIARFDAIDLVIRGEAEVPWASFLREANLARWDYSNVEGAVWKSAGEIHETPLPPLIDDLDSIPIPAFDAYRPQEKRTAASVEVGRGCPYGCTFCSTNTFFARRFRLKSPGRILREMDLLHQLFGIREFHFIHDMFTVRHELVESICEAIENRPYVWSCSARTDRLNPGLLEKMIRGGCRGLYCGIETGSQDLQRSIKKNLVIEDAVKTLRMAKAMGLAVAVSIIVGYPQETLKDLRASLLLALELMDGLANACQLPVFSPLADTPLANEGWAFAFDGLPSNIVDTPGKLSEGEKELIRSDYAIFSAFYHPSETEYARRDYLALATIIENFGIYPTVKKYLIGRARSDFVDYLLAGNFPVEPYVQGIKEICQRIILDFARKSLHHTEALLQLLQFESAGESVNSLPVGARVPVALPRSIADIAADRFGMKLPPGIEANVPLYIESTDGGIGLALREEVTPISERRPIINRIHS